MIERRLMKFEASKSGSDKQYEMEIKSLKKELESVKRDVKVYPSTPTTKTVDEENHRLHNELNQCKADKERLKEIVNNYKRDLFDAEKTALESSIFEHKEVIQSLREMPEKYRRKTLKKIYNSSQENSSKKAEMDNSCTSAIDKIKSEPIDEDKTSVGHEDHNVNDNSHKSQTLVAYQRTVNDLDKSVVGLTNLFSENNGLIQQLKSNYLRKRPEVVEQSLDTEIKMNLRIAIDHLQRKGYFKEGKIESQSMETKFFSYFLKRFESAKISADKRKSEIDQILLLYAKRTKEKFNKSM